MNPNIQHDMNEAAIESLQISDIFPHLGNMPAKFDDHGRLDEDDLTVNELLEKYAIR